MKILKSSTLKNENLSAPEATSENLSFLNSTICILLSCAAVFTLHCRFEIFGGGFPDSDILNGLNKLYNTFYGPDYADLFILIAIYAMLRFVRKKDHKADTGFLLFSLILSILLMASISYKKFNSADLLFANSFQIFISGFCIVGFWIILYGVLRCIYHLFPGKTMLCQDSCPLSRPDTLSADGRKAATGTLAADGSRNETLSADGSKNETLATDASKNTPGKSAFLEKHFFPIGFGIIFLGWLPWILLNYPGSGCPDGLLQLRQFLGEAPWSAGHPPLSSCIIGGLFTMGRRLADANFGFFLYCFFQTCMGAWIFSLSMKKLQKLGIPVKWCMWGILYFAFTPLWGTYAQWVEKDLLFAEISVLQAVCMIDILVKKECSRKDAILLACASLGTVFLRNNGIHAILPALLLLTIWLRHHSRKRALAVLLTTFLVYEGAVKILYPAMDIQGVYRSEALSIPFQQTARYVIEHLEDVTEYEKEVIDSVFGFESMFNYNPVISDPIKISYHGADLNEYYKIWFLMFFKHPGSYLSAFINLSYGYLAPVSQNIEGWIQEEYYDSMGELGLYHPFDVNYAYFLAQIWNLSMKLPLIKYLCTPGMYTWIVAVLAMLLFKRRRYSALILLVPSIMNILVCLASPLADAIRYELPTVASVPLLIGWTYYSLCRPSSPKAPQKAPTVIS